MSNDGILSASRIMEVGCKLLELRPVQEVLDAVIHLAAETMHAETAMIILKDGEAAGLSVAAEWHETDCESPGLPHISRSLLAEAFTLGEPVLTESAVQDPRFAGKTSIILQHIQAAVIIPMMIRGDTCGAIYLDSRSDRDLFRDENLGALSTLAAFASLAIENARRYESTVLELTKLQTSGEPSKGCLIGSSAAMQELYAMIDRVAATDLPVLITGESGSGKELVAREIHDASKRKGKPFVPLYCGNISPELFESELFGHKAGSFTGAVSDKPGLVLAAKGGTLFLDEVADIPLALQAKLLRFLQNSEYRSVGDTLVCHADVRILAATNKDLQTEIAERRFREDLFYRLYILPVRVPPLRERLTDIPLLIRHFLNKGRKTFGGPTGVSPGVVQSLMSYPWPGNVRELENVITRARVVAQGERIESFDLTVQDRGTRRSGDANDGASTDLTWEAAEKKHVLNVLALCDGNKSQAARTLGVSRRFLYYKLEQWDQNGLRPAAVLPRR
jgi:Nif-specific regulatory protein